MLRNDRKSNYWFSKCFRKKRKGKKDTFLQNYFKKIIHQKKAVLGRFKHQSDNHKEHRESHNPSYNNNYSFVKGSEESIRTTKLNPRKGSSENLIFQSRPKALHSNTIVASHRYKCRIRLDSGENMEFDFQENRRSRARAAPKKLAKQANK